ncbi:MAG: Gfo/Idh/MocA family oxidoreductase [Lentisphaeria bacterium]|nr:Gfo/Idh/MocA family oxidoreductase [Lentisphaeria bacterium]NQZ67404.1 Gfo/Idh/MocA family oxidoreductase [Lentisphaeria bacterium]
MLNLGIVGACGRGAGFKLACEAAQDVTVHAVCDLNEESLAKAKENLGAKETYTDYEEMIAKSDLQGVIIATPMPFHVPQAIIALDAGVSVLTEVPAATSVDQCKELVASEKASSASFMMAENYTYMRPNVIVREMVKRGEFGTPYFAEGEYIHELKGLNEVTKWRRKWQTGINGITYGTHSLGPILQWMPGDRVVSVTCAGSGHHYTDPRGDKYENEDSCTMLCKMASGGQVKIRVDMISDRPHSMTNYQLQGTDAAYESARAAGEKNRIWLRSRSDNANEWQDLADYEDEFLPDFWKEEMEKGEKAGHGGGDYFEILDFIAAVRGEREPDIGIHETMDMTLPGLISQASIEQNSQWLDVPDSRLW